MATAPEKDVFKKPFDVKSQGESEPDPGSKKPVQPATAKTNNETKGNVNEEQEVERRKLQWVDLQKNWPESLLSVF